MTPPTHPPRTRDTGRLKRREGPSPEAQEGAMAHLDFDFWLPEGRRDTFRVVLFTHQF